MFYSNLAKFGSRSVLAIMFFIFTLTIYTNQKFYSMNKNSLIKDPESIYQKPKCQIPGLERKKEFFDYLSTPEYLCQNLRWFGSGAGQKGVCMDPIFNITPGDCNVLSFGINNEWSFDDAMDKFGCKVYAFDPTMHVSDHQRSANIRFLNLGISNIKGKRKIGIINKWQNKWQYLQVDRYENILEHLNLTDSIIDYIKMDVELSELDFFQDVFRNSPHLLKNVNQIGMELHHGVNGEGLAEKTDKIGDMSPTSTFQLFWQYFHELRCYGFKFLKPQRKGKWTEALWGRV